MRSPTTSSSSTKNQIAACLMMKSKTPPRNTIPDDWGGTATALPAFRRRISVEVLTKFHSRQ